MQRNNETSRNTGVDAANKYLDETGYHKRVTAPRSPITLGNTEWYAATDAVLKKVTQRPRRSRKTEATTTRRYAYVGAHYRAAHAQLNGNQNWWMGMPTPPTARHLAHAPVAQIPRIW